MPQPLTITFTITEGKDGSSTCDHVSDLPTDTDESAYLMVARVALQAYVEVVIERRSGLTARGSDWIVRAMLEAYDNMVARCENAQINSKQNAPTTGMVQ